MRIVSSSPARTRHIAAGLAKKILRGKGKAARVVALKGELGSGKTVFAKGFLRALRVARPVQSPTFVIIKRYPLPSRKGTAFHIDAYRIQSAREVRPLGLGDALKDPSHIVLIEWPERLGSRLPKGTLSIRFSHGGKRDERIIVLP